MGVGGWRGVGRDCKGSLARSPLQLMDVQRQTQLTVFDLSSPPVHLLIGSDCVLSVAYQHLPVPGVAGDGDGDGEDGGDTRG